MTSLTFAELRERLENLPKATIPAMKKGMAKAALNVKAQAKMNCTPGKSPYAKAPYSDDNDPRREPIHMRDAMYHRVIATDKSVRGIIGNPKRYAAWVHEGTKKMAARPFILDAIKQKESETRAILSEALETALLQGCEGDLFAGGLAAFRDLNPTELGDSEEDMS